MTKLPTLYKRTSTGKIQQWTIWADGDSYYIEEGQVEGKLTLTAPHTCKPKNPGKKNATTAEQQAVKEAKADWDKKLERGYCEDINGIDAVTYRKPMKGYKWHEQAKNVVYPVTLQNKLNGIRCQSEEDRSYSTGGKTFHTIPHIREELALLFAEYPEGFFDGEAFNNELKKRLNRLVELVSVVIQPKDLTAELLEESRQIVRLHLFDGYGFDGVTEKTPYDERYAALTKLFNRLNKKHKFKYLVLEPCWKVNDFDTLVADLKKNRESDGEGLMIRWGDCPRKEGKSTMMLKLKHFDDAEYKVLRVEEGNADWVGCVKRVVLALPEPVIGADGKEQTDFAANILGDRPYLRDLWNNQHKIVGKQVTVEYQQLSEYGIPQIPWVTAIRDYE